MYLAPLNYDRYFRKVFSEISIAKKFLEDFLDVTIETIEPLNKEHKILMRQVLWNLIFVAKSITNL